MLTSLLGPQADRIYALFRFVLGALFAFHGAQKVFGFHADAPVELFSQLGLGGVIELVGGAFIAVGLFTRWAAFLCSGTMAVAYIQFHWDFQLDENVYPALNGGELAVLYCFAFLYVAAKGAGPLSLDRRG